MSMTEKEAKEKNCPFTFNIPGVQSSTAKEYLCIGSKCMAWEWDFRCGKQIACSDIYAKEEPIRPENVPANWKFYPYQSYHRQFHAFWEQPAEENRDNWTGHCHLIFRGAE